MNEEPQNTLENNSVENIKKPEEKKDSWLKDILHIILIIVFVVLPIRFWVAKPFVVSGASMYPTFDTGNYLIVDQLTYKFQDPQRGDVVVFKYPNDPSKYFIKRIIGLPNEKIILENKNVYIQKENSEKIKLEENYITLDKDTNLEKQLSNDEYFVMGDNRLQSMDSRYWGPLNKKYITGRAFIRLLPVKVLGLFPGKNYY